MSAHQVPLPSVPMNIRDMARWAEARGILTHLDGAGQPQSLRAVYDIGNHLVEIVGSYEICRAYMQQLCGTDFAMRHAKTSDGRYLRMDALSTICEEMDESEGESQCIPEQAYIREWF